MTTNEGVGKKIVEALKKQSNNDFELGEETEIQTKNVSDDLSLDINNSISDIFNSKADISSVSNEDAKFEIQEEPAFIAEQKEFVFDAPEAKSEETVSQNQNWNFDETQTYEPVFKEEKINISSNAKQFDMPANVAVLKKLITQLPTGVTKQTGAQIIKQTMEALGISMNSVLHDAQKVQDEMNDSIKNCMMSIQEYKNNIKNLEKQGLDYQRQVNQLNDLISLFILSDKD